MRFQNDAPILSQYVNYSRKGKEETTIPEDQQAYSHQQLRACWRIVVWMTPCSDIGHKPLTQILLLGIKVLSGRRCIL